METRKCRYDAESLIRINGPYHSEHGVNGWDVEMVNAWVEQIEKERSSATVPKPGDRIVYTSRHGDYSPGAMIDRLDNVGLSVCICPMVPFVSKSDDSIYCNVSGGPFTHIPKGQPVFKGKTKGSFKDWGHHGACGNGAVYFDAEVNEWEYAEPDPLYGDFTTRDWRRLYIYKQTGEQQDTSGYLYTADGMGFKTEEELRHFLGIFEATVFPGNWTNQLVAWCYWDVLQQVSQEEWDRLAFPTVTRRIQCGEAKVKVKRDDDTHTLTSYYVQSSERQRAEEDPHQPVKPASNNQVNTTTK